MKKIKFIETGINNLYVIETAVFADNRGYFMETYNQKSFLQQGVRITFVQDNLSLSLKGVLRGLHFQHNNPQGKLVRVLKGEVFDVAVDLRKESSTYKKWYGLILSQENNKALYVPEGFAHGFLVLSDKVEYSYKCTDFYHPEDEGGIIWNDPDIGIEWPLDDIKKPILSGKDEKLPTLSQIEERIKF